MADLVNWMNDYGATSLLLIVCGSGLIQVSPIKINPWTALLKWIGSLINGELIQKVDILQKTLNAHIIEDQDGDATQARHRILAFNSDILRGQKFTNEYWAEVLRDVDFYEQYCDSHPNYKNTFAEDAIRNVKHSHIEAMKNHDFL